MCACSLDGCRDCTGGLFGLGIKEVKAADSKTIAGWTNKNSIEGITVTENDDSIKLDCTNKVTKLGSGDLSNTVLLTIGEATT